VLETDSTNTILNDLIEFQDKIFKQRKQGFLIPDLVYKLFKSRFQQQEDWIAENVQQLEGNTAIRRKYEY
jgi:hypothetical protein